MPRKVIAGNFAGLDRYLSHFHRRELKAGSTGFVSSHVLRLREAPVTFRFNIFLMAGWQLPPQAPTPAFVASKSFPRESQPREMASSIVFLDTALHKHTSGSLFFLET